MGRLQLKPNFSSSYNNTIPRGNLSNMNLGDSSSMLRSATPLSHAFVRNDMSTEERELFHLVKPNMNEKAIEREALLPRILTSHKNLNTYSEQLFESIFSAYQGSYGPPLPIKYIFDFLDEQAERIANIHRQFDPQHLAHIWKSNCLPLRFWVNLIKNPDFLFDIDKPPSVDHTLTTIAQTLISACSLEQNDKGPNPSTVKMIAYEGRSNYQRWVGDYYSSIQGIGSLPSSDFKEFLDDENSLHSGEFNTMAAVGQLWSYVTQYYEELTTALNDDPNAAKFKLAKTLQQIEKGQYSSSSHMYSQNSSQASQYGSQHASHHTSYGSQQLPPYNHSNMSGYHYHSNSTLQGQPIRPIPAPRQKPQHREY